VATVQPGRDQPFSEAEQSRTVDWKHAFKDRLRLFLFRCAPAFSETTVKTVIREFSDKLDDEDVLTFLKSAGIKQVASLCSVELKKFVVEFLMRRFLQLHLKTNKTLAAKKGVKPAKGRGGFEDDEPEGAKSTRKGEGSLHEARKTPS